MRTRARRSAEALLAAALFAATFPGEAWAAPAPAQEPTPATAHVTYITGASLYLDAGRQEGLREGDVLEVTRDGAVIATVKVAYLSEHRASCAIVSSTTSPAAGDAVRFVPHASTGRRGNAAPSSGEGEAAGTARGGWASLGLHGRAGIRYLVMRTNGGGDNGFRQPAVDLRVDGRAVGGSDLDLTVDIRARQTYRNWSGAENERMNRIYRLAGTWHVPDSRQRITVGRQFAPNLEAVSLFDGVLYDTDSDGWGAGFFAGTQPDPADFGVDGTVREYGGYYLLHSRPQSERRWALTLGLIDSYADGVVNREWLYLQGRYHGPRLSGFITQEVDYNRDWKVSQAGEATISPTSTFANFNVRVRERLTLYAGYDNRRSIRLWQDRITPATTFDDSHREGGWGGASLRIGRHLAVSGDARTSTGGASGPADGYSANLSVDGLTRSHLGFAVRTTHYANDRSDGWLHSLSTGLDLGPRAHLDLSAGRVVESDAADPSLDRTDDWYGFDIQLLPGRTWFLSLSGERYTGTFQDTDQLYAALSWRF